MEWVSQLDWVGIWTVSGFELEVELELIGVGIMAVVLCMVFREAGVAGLVVFF